MGVKSYDSRGRNYTESRESHRLKRSYRGGPRSTLAMDQNWRAGLAQDSRNNIVNRIMETLQRHSQLSRNDGVTELWKIANRFEEKIFYAASDQHDYLRKVSLKMLNLETRAQNAPNGALPTSSDGTNSVRPLISVASGDAVQQVGQPGGIDGADIVWSKMQILKDKYLQDMNDLCNALTQRSQEHMPEEQLQRLTHYKNVLQRMMPYLIASKGSLPKDFGQEKVEVFEKQIVSIIETFKRRPKQVALQQQGNFGEVQAVQQQQTPQMNSLLTASTELQSNNASSTSFSLLQSNDLSLEQAMGVATEPTPLNSSVSVLHQGYIADQEQIVQLQLRLLQQPQQQQLLQAQQARVLGYSS